MALIALGLNHLCAPVALRERAAFSTDDTVGALGDLVAQPGVREAMADVAGIAAAQGVPCSG